MTLGIPQLIEDGDCLAAALAYAASGFYLLPVKTDTKDPGSVVGGAAALTGTRTTNFATHDRTINGD